MRSCYVSSSGAVCVCGRMLHGKFAVPYKCLPHSWALELRSQQTQPQEHDNNNKEQRQHTTAQWCAKTQGKTRQKQARKYKLSTAASTLQLLINAHTHCLPPPRRDLPPLQLHRRVKLGPVLINKRIRDDRPKEHIQSRQGPLSSR